MQNIIFLYVTPEAYGIEKVLSGIRQGCDSDLKIIQQSMIIFNTLFSYYM